MPLYTNEAGTPVTTQSMMKTFLSCPREAYYKYHLGLSPKSHSLPLERGKWFHTLTEHFYLGTDFTEDHEAMTKRFNRLPDENKEDLGDLPNDVMSLFKAYKWHYGDPQYKAYDWKVHEVEMKLEAEMPNGHIFRGKFDMLVEDDFGLWLVDHKTHKKFPNWEYRMLDVQSPMYIWLCRQNGIPVSGFKWNYVRTDGMSQPKVLKNGKSFYSKDYSADTDYPTFARAVKAARLEYPDSFGVDPVEKGRLKDRLSYLKGLRWNPNDMQMSPFFRRDTIEKSDEMIDRVLASAMNTSERMHSYDFSDPDRVERNINSCKGFTCSYRSLTMGDLVHGDSSLAQKQGFVKKDPLAYQDTNDQLT